MTENKKIQYKHCVECGKKNIKPHLPMCYECYQKTRNKIIQQKQEKKEKKPENPEIDIPTPIWIGGIIILASMLLQQPYKAIVGIIGIGIIGFWFYTKIKEWKTKHSKKQELET